MFRNIERDFDRLKLDKTEDKTQLQKIKEMMNLDQSSISQQTEPQVQTAEIQTPPLPNTPMPVTPIRTANVVPTTGLTQTESALLSPEEQLIRQRSRT